MVELGQQTCHIHSSSKHVDRGILESRDLIVNTQHSHLTIRILLNVRKHSHVRQARV